MLRVIIYFASSQKKGERNDPDNTYLQQTKRQFRGSTYGYETGEILSLKWENINLKHGFILLDKTKNGERREIPINGYPTGQH